MASGSSPPPSLIVHLVRPPMSRYCAPSASGGPACRSSHFAFFVEGPFRIYWKERGSTRERKRSQAIIANKIHDYHSPFRSLTLSVPPHCNAGKKEFWGLGPSPEWLGKHTRLAPPPSPSAETGPEVDPDSPALTRSRRAARLGSLCLYELIAGY